METGKPGLASVPVHESSVTTQAEKRMNIQVPPLTAVYLHAVPPAAAKAPLQLAMPPFYSKETLPFLTLHIASGLQPLPGLSLTAPATKPKSAGKHICPHCGRDCLKPSVLEKHLRCHTGERPYPCSTCGVSFKTQSNLYKHRRTQAHARLSSESEQSSLGSQDSTSSSKETCTSSLSLDEQGEETGSMESCVAPLATESTTASSPTKVHCAQMQGSEKDGPKEEHKQQTDNKPLGVGRHLPLQRQEATLFSKQWDCSVSKRKSQSHGSTDSGFSDSPGSALLDHSMDSLTESSKEHVEQSMSTSSERAHSEQEPSNTARKQEQELLVERISKLISENTAVVEDKQLENVRPRKTVLSKQGSIDLPMPYTYKNSFHFDMKISPTRNIGLKRHSRSGLCSVPSTAEHAPLIRSHSLPFNLTLMQPESSSSAAPHQSEYVTAVQSGSSSQISSTDLSRKPVNQNSSVHRLLVRQTAVDCNHTTDGPFTNLSVEEVCTGSLSWDGDGGDICGESNTRKLRKKKAEKFAYNKWYMYGGGTFKKLCDLQKSSNNIYFKGKNCQHEVDQGPVVHQEAVTTSSSATNFTNSRATACSSFAGLSVVSSVGLTLQKCHLISTNSSIKAPPSRNLSLSVLPLPATRSLLSHKMEAGQLLNFPKHSDSSSQLCVAHVPSDRKKQRTDGKTAFSMETDPNTPAHPPTTVTCSGPLHDTNLHKTPKHTEPKGALFLPSMPVSTSPAMSIPVTVKNTFLPKYQLKLPNTRGETLESASHVVGKSKGTEECMLSSNLLPNTSDQTSPSGTTCAKTCEGSVTLQTYKSSSVNASCSTENQLIFPGTVTTLCDAATSQPSQSLTSSHAVLHRQCTTTTTTSSLQDSRGRVCTVMQSVPLQSAQHCTPAAVSLPVTTAKYPTCATNTTAVSHHRPQLSSSLLQEHLSVAQDSTNPQNKANVGPDDPAVPCSIGSLDQTAQNIFHVHTADFQICLQIISDEQLALIVPQIEHASDPSQSQMCDIKEVFPECSQNKSQSVGPMEISNKAGKYKQPETQKETDGRESPLMLSTERITPQMSEHSGTTTSLDESVSPIGPSQQTHRSSHVSVVTQTQSSAGSLMSASLRNVKSGGTQTLEDEQALSPNLCADNLVLQGETDSQTVSGQHKLSMSPLSAHSVATQSNRVRPSGSSLPTLDTSAPQLQDRICSDSSETCLGQFISQTSRVQDVPAICSSSQILTAGLVDGGSLEESAAQEEQKSKSNAASPAEPESSDWGSNCCEGKAEVDHRCPEEHGVTAVTAKQKKERIKTNKQPDSTCRGVLLSDRSSPQEEETQIQGESFQTVRLSEQQPASFPQAHLEMLKSPSTGPQEALSPSRRSSLPVSLLKVNVVSPSQRNRESIVQNQQMQVFCESSSSHHAVTPQNLLTRTEPALQSFSHQEPNQSSFHVSPQQEEATESNSRTTGSCSRSLTSESLQHTSFSSDFRTLSSVQFSQVCQEDRPPAGLKANSPPSKNMHNTGPLSELFTHLDPTTAHEHTGQSSDCGRPDITNKYQSFFMVSSLCGFQPSEGRSSALRPVAISQDYREDTSSSDDEGKLIIEL